MAGQVYSFLNVQATIIGPGGIVPLGAGSANAKEVITVEFTEDKNRMTMGSDGSYMHSLIASKGGRINVRLLKTSYVNGLLDALYRFQTISSLFHGQNLLEVTDIVRGDVYTCSGVAFSKFPKNDYAEEGGMIEWTFDAGVVDPILGLGILPLLV